MYVLAVYIVTLVIIQCLTKFLPLEETQRKRIMQVSSCLATAVAIFFHYSMADVAKVVQETIPSKFKQFPIPRSDSFSQASVMSGTSLLSDF